MKTTICYLPRRMGLINDFIMSVDRVNDRKCEKKYVFLSSSD